MQPWNPQKSNENGNKRSRMCFQGFWMDAPRHCGSDRQAAIRFYRLCQASPSITAWISYSAAGEKQFQRERRRNARIFLPANCRNVHESPEAIYLIRYSRPGREKREKSITEQKSERKQGHVGQQSHISNKKKAEKSDEGPTYSQKLAFICSRRDLRRKYFLSLRNIRARNYLAFSASWAAWKKGKSGKFRNSINWFLEVRSM